MVVQHNIAGMNANRQLNITTSISAKSSEKLSSGYKINRAADDAAGLAISEKMRRQIRGLTQGEENSQDGVSWCQIADGALDEVDSMLGRVKELSVKAANETLTDEDRSYINMEVQKISAEIDRIHASTKFNEIPIFDGGMSPGNFQRDNKGSIIIETADGFTIEIERTFVGTEGKVDSTAGTEGVGSTNVYADSEMAIFVQNAAAAAVSNLANNYSQLFEAASSSGIKVGLELANIDGSNGTLAYAQLVMSGNATSTVMGYTLKVDTTDYPIDSFSSMTAAQKADLAGVIAHEMTHLVMYDTLTSGMLDTFPDWFVEGTAQTSSGDNGWVSNRISADSSEADVKSYMSKLTTMPYGAGYLGTMYLGQLASGSSDVSSANIARGLDNIMTYIAQGHSLSEAIDYYTDYDSQTAFERGFAAADAPSYNFVRNLLTERGDGGAGSLFSSLSQSEATIFGGISSSAGSSGGDYAVDRTNTRVANAYGSGFDFSSVAGGGSNAASVLYIQAGADNSESDRIPLKRYAISVEIITNHSGFDTSTAQNARNTLDVLNVAASNVSSIRSYYGALQNRLEHTIRNLGNVIENSTASESLIRDTDMAAEMVKFSNNNILAQAGQAMLAQANQTNQGVMALLQ